MLLLGRDLRSGLALIAGALAAKRAGSQIKGKKSFVASACTQRLRHTMHSPKRIVLGTAVAYACTTTCTRSTILVCLSSVVVDSIAMLFLRRRLPRRRTNSRRSLRRRTRNSRNCERRFACWREQVTPKRPWRLATRTLRQTSTLKIQIIRTVCNKKLSSSRSRDSSPT